MAFLETTFYHNTLEKWIIALALAVMVWGVLTVLRHVVYRRLLVLSRKTASPLDDLVALLVHKVKTLFCLAVSVYAGSLVLSLPHNVNVLLGKLIFLALLLQAAVWGTEIITFWVLRARQAREEGDASDAAVMSLLHFVVKVVLWAAVVLIGLDNLGVHITTLVAGLGVGGIAVALAVQNILGDLFASVTIVLDKPFVIGDFITVDDFFGNIEHIGLKTTRIRSLSGEQLVFPNSDLLKSRIRNYKRMTERRIVFAFGVLYQTPSDKLAAIPGIVKEVVEAQKQARFDRAHFKAFGASSLDFEVVYWVTNPDYTLYMDVQQAINLGLFRRFETEGIGFAYPTQTLYVEKLGAGGK
jgi:small-conductance mechanosensitive channel